MSDLIEHAKQEFAVLGWDKTDDEMHDQVCKDILSLLHTFSEQNHSGFSANYVLNLFDKLARYQPISPLTGNDDEWVLVDSERPLYQNKRCSHVFKDGDHAYDIEGFVFIDKDGCAYTDSNSRVDVEFPYTPHTEYVKEK